MKQLALMAVILGMGLLVSTQYVIAQDDQEIDTLNKRYNEIYEQGKYEEAIPVAQQLVATNEATFGSDHTNTATALMALAQLRIKIGDYAKAEPLYKRALSIREKALGPEHPDTTAVLYNLAFLYEGTRDYVKAEPLLQRGLEINERVLGPEHLDTAKSLNYLAGLYMMMTNYAKVEPLCKRALSIRENALGPESLEMAESLINLGELYEKMGDYAKAEPLYQRALSIREKVLGPEHPLTAGSLNCLAFLYHLTGEYAKAEPFYLQAQKIYENAYGPEDPNTATSLDNLAGLYSQMGDYSKAEPLYQRALKINEKALGPENLHTIACLTHLALLYQDMGEYAKAEPLFQRSQRIYEKTFGPEDRNTARSLANLAMHYSEMGDYAKAEPLFQRALKIQEKTLGQDDEDIALCLNSLALLYKNRGEYAKAEPFLERALSIHEKAFLEDPDTAVILNNMGDLYRCMGDYDKAGTLLERALKIEEKANPDHADTAACLNNLANLYSDRGDEAKAEPLLQRALKITEKTLGPDNPRTAACCQNLGYVSLDLGKKSAVLELANKQEHARLASLANVLSFGSEQQRLAYQTANGWTTYNLFATLGMAPETALAILRNKGVVLDSLLEDRQVAEASQNSEDRDLIENLRVAKQRLAQLTLEVPKDFSEQAMQLRAVAREKAAQQVEQLESTLGQHVAGLGRARRALGVTVEQIQAAIPSHTVLIELVLYSHYLGKEKLENRWGAVILASSGEPKWVCLGAAVDLGANIQLYQQLVRRKTDDAALAACLQTLYRQLWQPIEQVLPAGSRTIILSPDGDLNFVSFATLLAPDGQFLGEEYSLCYAASGRDLLRETKAGADSNMVVYANPDFAGASKVVAKSSLKDGTPNQDYQPPVLGQVASRSAEPQELQDIHLAPLPGTARESAALEAQARKWHWHVEVYVEGAATEAQLRSVRSPHILHLATHGFFLPETAAGGNAAGPGQRGIGGLSIFEPSSAIDLLAEGRRGQQVVLKNPMYRSGLALAGAQATLEAWMRGEVPPMENDGIVTAEEVGGLKLEGTWLVTLSACDTGIGEARSGEGVLGLRRGFIQAGAQNLLMTLWSVADEETARLMVDFYAAAHESGNAPSALAEVQRDWLVRLRKERGLAAAVNIAGPFILSFQGPIQGR